MVKVHRPKFSGKKELNCLRKVRPVDKGLRLLFTTVSKQTLYKQVFVLETPTFQSTLICVQSYKVIVLETISVVRNHYLPWVRPAKTTQGGSFSNSTKVRVSADSCGLGDHGLGTGLVVRWCRGGEIDNNGV